MTSAEFSLSPRVREDENDSAREFLLGRVVPLLAAFAMGIRYSFTNEVTFALLVSVVLAPVWLGQMRRYRGMALLALLGLLAIASGIVLTLLDSSRTVSVKSLMLTNSLQLLGILGMIGVLLWARSQVGSAAVAVAYGLGLLINVAVTRGVSQDNAFKFSFSIPLTVIVLGLAALARSRKVELAWVMAVAAVLLVWADSRSMSAMLALTLMVMLWQLPRRATQRRVRPSTVLLVIGLSGLAVYQIMQAVILDGVLGEAAQARSELQLQASGSLVTGGRPELGATLALLLRQPWGYGSGVLPTSSDVWAAKSGMHVLNYDPNNGYVGNYMFGSGYEVHSVLGDLWIRFGLVGALLAVALVVYCWYGLAHRISTRSASALLVFLTLNASWDLFFTPLRTASYTFVLAVALAALPAVAAQSSPSPPKTRRSEIPHDQRVRIRS